MPIHVSICCDHRGCHESQPATFEARTETFGTLLEAYRSAGWKVTFEDGGPLHALCPEHAREAAAAAPTEAPPA